MKRGLIALCILLSAGSLKAQQNWTGQQEDIIQAMDQLGTSTTGSQEGIHIMDLMLSHYYSRWEIGSAITVSRDQFINSVNDWLQEGWHVDSRQNDIIDIVVREEVAYVRRIVEEYYIGPKEQKNSSISALDETWIMEEGEWKLYRVTIKPIPTE